MSATLSRALLGLLPVLLLLAALRWLDGYKLVGLRSVVAVVACGALIAAVTYPLHAFFLGRFSISLPTFSHYVAPVSEEALKALVVLALVRTHRVGFLVDAAIFGFAVGTGFAVAENLQVLRLAPGAGLGLWLVRGFGTALMHGGATAIVAVLAVAVLERRPGAWARAFLPGLALAVLLHSAFNHFFVSPAVSTLGIVLVLPPLLHAVFQRSERSLGEWLGKGFDADAAMLELIHSGAFAGSPAGRYLHALRDRFAGPLVADLLCYLRIHTELALRAKGVLLMRESGFEVPVDPTIRDAFAELRFLERSIGRTGMRALEPMLSRHRQEVWQLTVLGG